MLKLIAVLLVLWVAVSIIGAVVEGLFWLTVVGLMLFLATAAYGYVQRRSSTDRSA